MSKEPLSESELGRWKAEIDEKRARGGRLNDGVIVLTLDEADPLIALAREAIAARRKEAAANEATNESILIMSNITPPARKEREDDTDRVNTGDGDSGVPICSSDVAELAPVAPPPTESGDRDNKCQPCGANPYEDCPRSPCEYTPSPQSDVAGLCERLLAVGGEPCVEATALLQAQAEEIERLQKELDGIGDYYLLRKDCQDRLAAVEAALSEILQAGSSGDPWAARADMLAIARRADQVLRDTGPERILFSEDMW